MREALKEAGIIMNPQVRKILIYCISKGPIFFKELFTTFPSTNAEIKKFLTAYQGFAEGYNIGGYAITGHKDLAEEDKLPTDFMSLAVSLGYQGDNPKHAWLYVMDIVTKEESINNIDTPQKYVTHILKRDILAKVDEVFKTQGISQDDKEKLISTLEKLNKKLGGHFRGYTKIVNLDEKIDSLTIRLRNRIWAYNKPDYNGKNRPYDEQRIVLNELEGLLRSKI